VLQLQSGNKFSMTATWDMKIHMKTVQTALAVLFVGVVMID